MPAFTYLFIRVIPTVKYLSCFYKELNHKCLQKQCQLFYSRIKHWANGMRSYKLREIIVIIFPIQFTYITYYMITSLHEYTHNAIYTYIQLHARNVKVVSHGSRWSFWFSLRNQLKIAKYYRIYNIGYLIDTYNYNNIETTTITLLLIKKLRASYDFVSLLVAK